MFVKVLMVLKAFWVESAQCTMQSAGCRVDAAEWKVKSARLMKGTCGHDSNASKALCQVVTGKSVSCAMDSKTKGQIFNLSHS